MVSRAVAAWIIVLIVSPFSAPFCVCDLLGSWHSSRPHSPGRPTRGVLDHDSSSHGLPGFRVSPRVTFMATSKRAPLVVPPTVVHWRIAGFPSSPRSTHPRRFLFASQPIDAVRLHCRHWPRRS